MKFKEIDGFMVPTECPYMNCHSSNICNHGYKRENRRYRCKECNRTFTVPRLISYLHKSHENKFELFLECFINKLSLKRSSEICGISIDTAFTWRHKILNIITGKQTNEVKLFKDIEIDEIYFKKNSKGNYEQGFHIKKPKKKKYEAKKDRRGLSRDKLCITTAYNTSTKKYFTDFVGYGKPNHLDLYRCYKNVIVDPKNTTIIGDGETAYVPLCKKLRCRLKSWKGNHVNHVNSFHSQIRNNINNIKFGVASYNLIKYINCVE